MIDGFLDQETLAIAQHAHAVPFNHQGFDETALKNALTKLDANAFFGCVYGSGIEGNPALIQVIQEKVPVFGNSPATVKKIKNATDFFSTLANLAIPSPPIFNDFPKNLTSKILVKSALGAGGQHIRFAKSNATLAAHEYLQKYIEGESVSVLFLAEKSLAAKAHVIGFNLQWTSPTDTQPFRFGGIASNHDLPEKIKKALVNTVQKLTEAFELVGLNSLDVVIRNEEFFVLEINPRLSASVDLYAKFLLEKYSLDLINLHMQSCAGEHFSESTLCQLAKLPTQKSSTAMAIVYADQHLELNDIAWPTWVSDKPEKHAKILKESPVCSVISEENNALLAESLAKTRVNFVKNMLSVV